MSIIQQLAEIEAKALKYKQQDTLYIYTRHPRSGESVPQFELRIDVMIRLMSVLAWTF